MRYLNIQKTVYKVNDFISWQRSGSLILSPSFQRRPVWTKSAKSYLLDTIIEGLPIPIIFIRERIDLNTLEPRREVIDGQQRLRTLISYIIPSSLNNFNPEFDDFTISKIHNKKYALKKFQELPQDIQRKILNYEFSVHVLPTETEDREVLQIFARMNSTGVRLNKQEIRNANYFGEFKQLSYLLAYEQLNRWREWQVFTENEIARMLEVETTSDIIIMMFEGIVGKSQPRINKYYEEFEEEFVYSKVIANRFRETMNSIEDVLGLDINSTEFTRRPLFFSLFCVFYHLLYGLQSPLLPKEKSTLDKNLRESLIIASEKIALNQVSEDLQVVFRGATGNKEIREKRLDYLVGEINRGKAL